MNISAIVPALNEGKNVGIVIKTLVDSGVFCEVILVDDGSMDNTAEAGKQAGAKVISLPKKGGSGKGNAMRVGTKTAQGEAIAFFDADLIGLKKEHILAVVGPVINGEAEMSVGVRERHSNLPNLIVKIDPLMAIGGERAMQKSLFLALPEKFIQGFAVETALNYYCKLNKLKVVYPLLENLEIIIKEKKWGFWKGFKNRLKMMGEMIRIRVLIILERKSFKKISS